MRAQSLRLLTAAIVAAPAAALLALASPAHAAEAPVPAPCPNSAKTTKAATADCSVHWDGQALSPASARIQAGVTVTWINDDTPTLVDPADTVYLDSTGGPKTFNKEVPPEGGRRIQLFDKAGKATYSATTRSVADPDFVDGTIVIVPVPTPDPTPAPTKSTSPSPPSTGTTPNPTRTTPAPGATVLGQGQANVPTLGSGNLFPSPGATPVPLGPLVAGPDFVDPNASPIPDATQPQAGASLAQPVDARRLGLPGALAAVLVAGVLVGVVRLARAEYGLGGPQPPAPPST
jgi:plastocyanin